VLSDCGRVSCEIDRRQIFDPKRLAVKYKKLNGFAAAARGFWRVIASDGRVALAHEFIFKAPQGAFGIGGRGQAQSRAPAITASILILSSASGFRCVRGHMRHAGDADWAELYVSGLQHFGSFAPPNLGLRPRLVCCRAVGPRRRDREPSRGAYRSSLRALEEPIWSPAHPVRSSLRP
jgi:hypothetical protein